MVPPLAYRSRSFLRSRFGGGYWPKHVRDLAANLIVAAFMPSHILHLSDLHFGADHGFLMPGRNPVPGEIETDLADAVAEDLSLQHINEVAGVIISGDFMTHARWVDHLQHAYDILVKLCDRINLDRRRLFIVPGNHDYDWYQERDGKVLRRTLAAEQADPSAIRYGHEVQFNHFMERICGDRRQDFPQMHSLELNDYVLEIGLLELCAKS